MKLTVKRSILAGMGGFAAVIVAALLISGENREIGVFYLVFAAAFLLLNFLLYLPASKLRRRGSIAGAAVLICAVNLVLALSVSIFYLQEKMLFYPSNSVDCFEQLQSDPSFRKISVTAKDGTRLSGWLRPGSEAGKAPLLLYFGGNGQNSSKTFSGFLKQGIFSSFNGYGVMMVDYRGYGYSEGKPDDRTMFSDALDIYDYAVKQPYADPSRVVPLGYSIGTGEAVYLASQRRTAGLVLVAPYYSGQDLYNGMLDIFHGPMTMLIRYRFDTEKYAPQVACRPLVFTSKTDEMIGWKQSEALSKRFPSGARLELIDGATHNTYFKSKVMTGEIQDYLTKIREASR